MDAREVRDPAVTELLRCGRLEVTGRILSASNATLVGTVEADGVTVECVYKPVRGERPLWDFPDGTLAGREVASYLVSESAGWGLVPPTVLRDGPFGPGMVQLWIETDTDVELVDVVEPRQVPDGWRVVLHARDHRGNPAVLAHADRPELRRMALLDDVINNADRKGGHVLVAGDGAVYGVDHGVCLHTEDKLRTVLWGWVGEPVPDDLLDGLARLRRELDGSLCTTLTEHLSRSEVAALSDRVAGLLAAPEFPAPSGHGPAIPWPAF
ncbi:MAG: SCO1664 family protein [Pseudonocardiales bacterium]|nr:SCO1664 family protein [Pseudonocardiales bacterium]